MLTKKRDNDEMEQDGASFLRPRDYFNWVARHNYQRRCKMNPLWVGTVIGGVNKQTGEQFLGMADLYGLALEQNYILTGMSTHYCQVIMEKGWRPDLTEQEAKDLLLTCASVMFCRDKKAMDKLQISVTTREGVRLEEPVQVDSNWSLSFYSQKTNEFWRPMRIRN